MAVAQPGAEYELRSSVLLSLQRALLGAVGPRLRAVAVGWDRRGLEFVDVDGNHGSHAVEGAAVAARAPSAAASLAASALLGRGARRAATTKKRRRMRAASIRVVWKA